MHDTPNEFESTRPVPKQPDQTVQWEHLAKLLDDFSKYPSMSEIREQLYLAYEKQFEQLEMCPEDQLDVTQDYYPFLNNFYDGIIFFYTHEMYHAGQIEMIRRMLNRDSAFG